MWVKRSAIYFKNLFHIVRFGVDLGLYVLIVQIFEVVIKTNLPSKTLL